MKATARDYEIKISWSEPDQFFVAHVVEMPGVMADGPTREAAAREIDAALEATIEAAEEHGHPLPAPRRLAGAPV
jgi:predicted RNase H-like HicB family nuclease